MYDVERRSRNSRDVVSEAILGNGLVQLSEGCLRFVD